MLETSTSIEAIEIAPKAFEFLVSDFMSLWVTAILAVQVNLLLNDIKRATKNPLCRDDRLSISNTRCCILHCSIVTELIGHLEANVSTRISLPLRPFPKGHPV